MLATTHYLLRSKPVETLSGTQLKGLMQRWGFAGIGLVSEPLEPQVQFLAYEKGFNL